MDVDVHGPLETSPTSSLEEQSLAAVQFARAITLIKQHGLTGLILVLLAFQMGWLGQAQSTMCGI